ncbi:hypothetical protein SCP_1700870 [Sparassis crispa]|uniref:Uncharacterized protein n=1 Tax=Sparassis crispa TaxID=139825 RepID=A0A401H5S4_9APHY|nr:hypothetical protein SCP_1700870 [Sparassis crispa]GBE89762.1 hypothetical protein SCP_1700870 [Sparassis crispa]
MVDAMALKVQALTEDIPKTQRPPGVRLWMDGRLATTGTSQSKVVQGRYVNSGSAFPNVERKPRAISRVLVIWQVASDSIIAGCAQVTCAIDDNCLSGTRWPVSAGGACGSSCRRSARLRLSMR